MRKPLTAVLIRTHTCMYLQPPRKNRGPSFPPEHFLYGWFYCPGRAILLCSWKGRFFFYLDIFFNSGGLAILLVIISFFLTLCDDENRTSTEQEYSQIVIFLPAKIVI